MAGLTHDCPGQCGKQVPQRQLSCKPCWYRLPQPIRFDVNTGYAKRRLDGGVAHRKAMRAAFQWYRANPVEEPDTHLPDASESVDQAKQGG